jgi:hypothetical protein
MKPPVPPIVHTTSPSPQAGASVMIFFEQFSISTEENQPSHPVSQRVAVGSKKSNNEILGMMRIIDIGGLFEVNHHLMAHEPGAQIRTGIREICDDFGRFHLLESLTAFVMLFQSMRDARNGISETTWAS